MATYVAAELSFEIADGFVDQTIDSFVAPADEARISFTIAREPRTESPLAEHAEQLLAQLPEALPRSRIIARRATTVGMLEAYEARVEARASEAAVYQRMAFVGYYDTVLVLTATSQDADRVRCDEAAERWFESFRFRKQP